MIDQNLKTLFEDALKSAEGSDPLSQLKRASLEAFASQIPELQPKPQTQLVLRLAGIGLDGGSVSAAEAGAVLGRLQRAIARLAKARRTRVFDVSRLHRTDFEQARIDVYAAAPGSLVIDIRPHQVPDEDDHYKLPGDTSSWSELAMTELVEALPETLDDEDSVDALAAAEPVLRRAIADLVRGRSQQQLDLEFDLARPGRARIKSRLSSDQARELRRTLSTASEDRVVERRRGRLDGLRTRRRLFYLDVPSGQEIHGLIDEELLPQVRENLDKIVVVTLEVLVTRTRAGQAGHRRYRLTAIEPPTAETSFDDV